ncbi:MAG TPA: pseudouridine synthase [bacterium]|nr:pseudouridine synthase [bacterium]HPR88423.1 pseudouridine synthase [bacterium]
MDQQREANGPGIRVGLERAFSKLGRGSRAQARDWILAGRVKVNGRVERFVYAWVDLEKDEITLDDRPLGVPEQKLYYLFHKPAGFLTARTDPASRATVYDLLPDFATWVFPAGRLDMDSEGALFLTNDGPLSGWLVSPESGIEKCYRVRLHRPLQEADRLALEAGIDLRGYRTRPAQVRPMPDEKPGPWAEIIIHEGKNRQVRRMFAARGYEVVRLIRVRIGPIELGDLPPGAWRPLTAAELAALRTLQQPGGSPV